MGSPNHEEKQQQHQEQEHQANSNANTSRNPPPPPEPSKDAGIVPPIKSPTLQGLDHLTPDNIDIFTLDPVAALKLLCQGTQLLVDMTGDIPPTPPVRSRGTSPKGEARLSVPDAAATPIRQRASIAGFGSRNENDSIDGVPFVRTPIGSPEALCHEPLVHGDTSQPAAVQHAVLARKFYSKRPPPISLDDYLARMHKYCPLSTAVYLATSHYISHLAVREKLLPVTTRNVHRLVLVGLRVAMKALEDLSWPHGRFAKVGGISESELGKLEVGFCFLMDFNLKVDAQMLSDEAQNLMRIHNRSAIEDGPDGDGMRLDLPESKQRQAKDENADTTSSSGGSGQLTPRTAEKRKASSSLPVRPVQIGQGLGIVSQS